MHVQSWGQSFGAKDLRRFALTVVALWLITIGCTLAWNLRQLHRHMVDMAVSRMASSIERTLIERRTDSDTTDIPVTLFRHDFNKEDPAASESIASRGRGIVVSGRLVSLSPALSDAAPDPWERESLEKMRRGAPEVVGIMPLNGTPHLRFLMTTPQTKPDRGFSISVPMSIIFQLGRRESARTVAGYGVIAAVGLLFIAAGYKSLRRRDDELKEEARRREELLVELQRALAEIKTLSGILPICASCKRIRDDKGYWNRVESYIQTHSAASFTHGICPECARKLYPDYCDDEPGG